MSTNQQDKAKHNLLRQIWQLSKTNPKQQIEWLLRSLLVAGKQANTETGFVLPTVAMVSLVVVLISVALVVRAFDRSRNASNTRVNQVVLNAATPALDRARAKLDALFSDPTLPRATPSDIALDNAIKSNRYNFGDETRLKLVYEINGTAGIQKPTATTPLEDTENITTAWKYPVDTNNDGKFDSYTLYGIYFRSPSRNPTTGKFNRQRYPLDARTPPMSGGLLGNQCSNSANTIGSLVGDSSWYKTGTRLTKSFYVYTTTVPITTVPTTFPPNSALTADDFRPYAGNKGFSALEYQQDRSQIPLNNNAVLFQDDLELSPGPDFRLNGRVFTNANLLIGGHGGSNIRLFQVSSKNSCFYQEENAKITVGGNLGTGNINDATDQRPVTVDLYNGVGNDPNTAIINGSNKSTTSGGGAQVGYNDAAYNNRIALMEQTALSYHPDNTPTTYQITPPPTIASVNAVTQYPQEVKDGFSAKVSLNPSLDTQAVLTDQIEIYLKDRTRRVPYAEIATPDTNALSPYTSANVFTAGTIEPPAVWREPTDANTRLTLTPTQLAQTEVDKQKQLGKEVYLGDRINIGNNLPAYWKNAAGRYVTGLFERQLYKPPVVASEVFWTDPADKTRYRTTQVVALPDLGISDRTGFWEDAAAQTPPGVASSTGGLRIITGAGIYVDDDGKATGTPSYSRNTFSFLRNPQLEDTTRINVPELFTTSSITTGNDNIVTWFDTMPMTGGAAEIALPNPRKGDLLMRATAIYHYKDSSYTDTNYINRTPTACISSYYDPTNSVTARNPVGLPDVSGTVTGTQPAVGLGRSNNGVVYPTPYTSDAARVTAVSTYRTQLNRQARLVFPDGRIVNEPLRNALKKIDAAGTRSLADNSAIDTAICGIRILTDTTFTPNLAPPIAHGAIEEASFLDARQVKALDRTPVANGINPISPKELATTSADGNYNLQFEQRQPLEIRVTDIDMNLLRTQIVGGTPNQEYMLPNSGIIYATRDDGLLDKSNPSAQSELLSPTDFKLDPTRRPNGIRLYNGSNLARDNNYRQEEKGLILVTNLPTYIRGDFNLHQKPGGGALREEFMEKVDTTWGNFYSRNTTPDKNFACRINQPGCDTEGDQWRPATIISDATSLMSANFRDGFRDWGDYDLNNNGSFSTIRSRLKNGFFENSFATSALWWNTGNTGNLPLPSGKTTNSYVSSYLTNGVSPVQRRSNFSEYVMEICRKVPVSECQPSDWVVGYDSNGDGNLTTAEQNIRVDQLGQTIVASGKSDSNSDNILQGTEVNWANQYTTGSNNKSPLERLGAGTTARPSLVVQDQRYARRVAFSRDRSGALVFLTLGIPPLEKTTAQPIGVGCPLDALANDPLRSGCIYPDTTTRTLGTHYATSNSNALWFRTTNSITSEPGSLAIADVSYAADRPLYYTPPRGGKLLLPDTECFNNTNTVDCSSYPTLTPGVVNLNYPTTDKASDYALCLDASGTNSGSSKAYQISKIPAGGLPACSSNPLAAIDHARTQMANFTAGGYTGGFTTTGGRLSGGTITATAPVVVYDIAPNTARSGSTLTLDAGLQTDAVFVLRLGNFSFGDVNGGNGVKVVLKGVSPNNVFWVNTTGSSRFENANAASPHQVAGNFIGKSASPTVGTYTEIMGRFLGFTTAPNFFPSPPTGVKITSIASTDQPALAPVLQVHSPGGTPAAAFSNPNNFNIQRDWGQIASTNTTFNVAFVTGNSPSRPAEESAGLHNFVRFMENWGATVNIKGSFIQLKRSAYATGPFSPLRSTGVSPITGSNDGSLSIFGYSSTLYPQGGGGNTLTFYGAPTRQWGFDVALLSQPPDLFAQRFTQQTTSAPDEFFRQVGQDDPWVRNLLCAAQKDPSSSTYSAAIGDQRPASCPTLGSYSD